MAFPGNAQTHNNVTKKVLTYVESLTSMQHKTQKWPKPKNCKNCRFWVCTCNDNGSSNNLSSYPPDSHQSQNAIYWRMGRV